MQISVSGLEHLSTFRIPYLPGNFSVSEFAENR